MVNKDYRGFIGTYTKESSKGIYTFILDTQDEKIREIKLAAELGNPTYLAISEDQEYLYAVRAGEGEGGVAAYRINSESGALTPINSAMTEGTSPCYVAVNDKNDTVVAAYYHRGQVAIHPVKPDGTLGPASSVIQHEGSGPNKERQEKPHVHYSEFTPDGKYVVAIDLGTDQIVTYTLTEGRLAEVASLRVRPGSGPRHLDFHPNGKYAYVMTELSNEIIVLEYNREAGSFTELQYHTTLPEDFSGHSQGAAIHVTGDGRFVYVSNRGHNSIAVFAIEESTGKVHLVEHVSTEGNWPRDFVLDPSERYLICANERSHNLTLYKRDRETGRLSVLQKDVQAPEPVCVKFLK